MSPSSLPSPLCSLMSQLKSDAEFLREIGVMDYSLLLGVHFTGRRYEQGI